MPIVLGGSGMQGNEARTKLAEPIRLVNGELRCVLDPDEGLAILAALDAAECERNDAFGNAAHMARRAFAAEARARAATDALREAREAVEFYADDANWHREGGTGLTCDGGARARAALVRLDGEPAQAGGRTPSSDASDDPVRVGTAQAGERQSAEALGGPGVANQGVRRPADREPAPGYANHVQAATADAQTVHNPPAPAAGETRLDGEAAPEQEAESPETGYVRTLRERLRDVVRESESTRPYEDIVERVQNIARAALGEPCGEGSPASSDRTHQTNPPGSPSAALKATCKCGSRRVTLLPTFRGLFYYCANCRRVRRLPSIYRGTPTAADEGATT